MSISFQLIAIFSNVWFIGLLVVVETLWVAYYVDALGNTADRAYIKSWLKSDRGTRLYRETVGQWLDRIDRFLTPKNMVDTPRPTGGWWRSLEWRTTPMAPSREVAELEARRAWSWPLFDFALRLAVMYPLIAMIATWAATGGAGQIGESTVLDAEPSRLIRAATTGGISTIFLFMYLSYRATAQNDRVGEQVYMWLAAAAIVATSVTAAAVFATAGTFAAAVAFFTAGATAAAIAVAFAAGVATAGAVAVATAVAFEFVAPVVGVVSFAVAVGLVIFLAVNVRRSRGLMSYCIFVVVLLGFTAIAAIAFETTNVNAITVSVFLGLLPILNAIFDFLSLCLTRWLVRAGVNAGNRWTLVLGIVDLFSATVFFAALGFTLIWVLRALSIYSGSYPAAVK